MKRTKEEIIKDIENAITKTGLKQKDLDSITMENMKKICQLADIELIDLMHYLRFERNGGR